MITQGLPDLLSQHRFARQEGTLNANLDAARQELVTGLRTDLESAPSADMRGVLAIDRDLARLDIAAAATASARTASSLAQGALGTIQSILQDTGVSLVAAASRGDPITIDGVAAKARSGLEAAFSALNVSAAGRSLFAGAAVDRAPLAPADALLADVRALVSAAPDAATAIADVAAYFDTPGGGFETAIYQGSANAYPSVDLGDGSGPVSASPNADHAALRDALHGLALAAAVDAAPFAADPAQRDALLSEAGEVAIASRDAVIALRADLGRMEERISLAEARNAAAMDALSRGRNDLAARDPFDAASEVQALEGQLQALYAVTARLSQLSLLSFLR